MIEIMLKAEFFASIVRMATPLLFVGMAAVIGAKADILCIAYEAMMLFSALGGVVGSALTQNILIGTLVGVVSGLIIATIFAYFVLYLDTQPLLAGLALNTLGTGGTIYIVYLLTGMKQDTSALASMRFPEVNIPFIQDIPVVGSLLSGHNLLSYLAIISVVLVWYLIYRTRLGLRIRASGENPTAAQSVGINVKRTKFTALLISGVLASFGGMFMSMAYMPYFTNNMTAGRGFIGIAAQNLGRGNPLWTMLYTFVFGASMAVGNTAQSFRLPSQFASVMPYLLTLIGLVVIGIRNNKVLKQKAISVKNKERIGVSE